MGGSFNTREFFHDATPAALQLVRHGFVASAFLAPIALLAWALATSAAWVFVLAAAVQFAGLLAERWYFLADANLPQNLYYQMIS